MRLRLSLKTEMYFWKRGIRGRLNSGYEKSRKELFLNCYNGVVCVIYELRKIIVKWNTIRLFTQKARETSLGDLKNTQKHVSFECD